jgi:hypothetical protein
LIFFAPQLLIDARCLGSWRRQRCGLFSDWECDDGRVQQGGDVAAADAGVRRRRRVHDGQPDRRLLAVRGYGLAPGPAAPGGLRHRVRAQRAGRQGRPRVRGDGLVGPRRGEPGPRHAPARRRAGRPAVDRVRGGHDDPAEGGAAGEQLQDDRRARRGRAHRRGRRVRDAAVRVERDHPRRARARLRPRGERQRAVVADALRVAHAVGRRRHLAVRGAGRVGGPLRAVAVRRRAHRRHHGVHRRDGVQQLLRAAQRGDAARRQRRVPAGLGDAGHHRVQPVRAGAGAADAAVPAGLLPRREQRLHVVGDVRHRRQRQPHHQQPGEPVHRPSQPRRQGGEFLPAVWALLALSEPEPHPLCALALDSMGELCVVTRVRFWAGDEACGDGGEPVDRVELADGGGHDGERRLLRALRRGPGDHLREGLQRRSQVGGAGRHAHAERRRPRRAQVHPWSVCPSPSFTRSVRPLSDHIMGHHSPLHCSRPDSGILVRRWLCAAADRNEVLASPGSAKIVALQCLLSRILLAHTCSRPAPACQKEGRETKRSGACACLSSSGTWVRTGVSTNRWPNPAPT